MPGTEPERIFEDDGRHLRVLGPPGSGKTTALVERFERLSANGRRPVVVAFSRSERERLVERLLPRRSAHTGRVPVYTYHQIALDVVARAEPGRRRPLGDVEERIVLARALRATAAALSSDYASILESDAFQRALLEIFHALLQNGVSAADAERLVAAAHSRRARDVMLAFTRFLRALDDKGLTTFYDVSWRAARLLEGDRSLDPLAGCDALLIDDFQDIDAGQFRLVETLAPPAGGRRVSVFGDPTGARFAFRGTSARFLRDEFVERYAPRDVRLACAQASHPTLAIAVRTLLAETGAEEFAPAAPPRESPAAVGELPLFRAAAPDAAVARAGLSPETASLVVAEDEIAEAQHVAAAAALIIRSGRYRAADVAVIARDRARYEMVLSLAMHDYGVPFDAGTRGQFALETFVAALLGLTGGRFDERSAEAVVTSPFYDAFRGAFAERLELGVRRADRDAGELRRVVGFVRAVCADRASGAFSMSRFLDECVRPVVEAVREVVADEAVASIARMADAWDAYEGTLRSIGGRPGVGEFLAYYRAGASAASAERDSRCVGFFTAREAATRSFPVVFVVGCADGVFPAADARESYIPFDELQSIAAEWRVEFYRARARAERLRDEYALMLTAITRAERELHVSAPRKMLGETVPAPARAVESLGAGGARASAERQEGPRLRAARAVAEAGPGFAAALDVPMARVSRLWLEPRPAARRFAVDAFALSPSRLSLYVECARRFFYTRVLGIEEDRTIHLTIGSLFHEVLDRIGKELPTRDELLAGLTPERIDEIVDDAVRSSRDLGPEGSLVESVSRFHLAAMVRHFRSLEARRVDSYRIDTELAGDFSRGGFAFSGRMDRVDTAGGRARVVIDYKTSASQGANSIHKTGKTVREYMLGRKGADARRYWQIPMYARGARAAGDRYPDLFCYYVVPPGEDPYVTGVFISDDPDAPKRSAYFDAHAQRGFASVTPGEVDAVLDEVVARCAEIFAERDAFPRTDDVARCRTCSFNRVCERRDA